MRAHELLSEKIDLISYYPDIVDIINSAIIKTIKQVKSAKSSYIDLKDKVNSQGSISVLNIQPFLRGILEQHLRVDLVNKFKNFDGPESLTDVVFQNINAQGQANFESIELSREIYSEKLTKIIFNAWYDFVLDSLSNEEDLFDDFFDLALTPDFTRNLIQYNTESVVKQLSSTIVHELTHITQHNRQRHRGYDQWKRPDIDYYSYLDNPKLKKSYGTPEEPYFRGELKQLSRKVDDNPSTEETSRYYKLYHSSPQEITAFAHQHAIDFVSNYGLFDTDMTYAQLQSQETDILNYISKDGLSYYTKDLAPSSNNPRIRKIERKIYNRYLKLIAGYVMSSINQLKQKAAQREKD